MRSELIALAVSGVVAGLLEVLWALVLGQGLFLTVSERLQYAFAALSSFVVISVLAGVALKPALRGGTHRLVYCGVFAFSGGWVAFALTSGRRVHDLWFRPLLVLAASLVIGSLAFCLFSFIARMRRQADALRVRVAFAYLPLGALALGLDQHVLPNGYPAFHGALACGATLLTAAAGLTWPAPRLRPRVERAIWAVLVVLLVVAPWLVSRLRAQPNTSYVVERVAPWSKKVLALSGRWSSRDRRRDESPQSELGDPSQGIVRRIDLRDRDILVITVDALRADALAAYGGRGLTPELDKLADESVVFHRAYTPAPHTSYALSSLLTAKYIKPVFEIPGSPNDHPTLPDLLRRYGYRTSAFYPPAIFFVDGARFDALRERGFGFEYRKEMYASAPLRVKQLEEYLVVAEAGHPLFVWMHLFEPHEPYDPPEGLASDDSARGRYDGEIRAADRAIGELVRVFRAARPGSTVIVTADHGEEFGDHGGQFHGSTLYDEQVRVPLLWSSPQASRRKVDVPVDLTDVGTTLLSAAGVPREARMRGDDLSGVLVGDDATGPKYTYASIEDRHMVSDGKLKLICAVHDEHCRLFDLVADPSESRDLRIEKTEDVTRLRVRLDAFLSSIPKVEAIAVADGSSWPEPLARARLNAPGAGPDVVPLLSDDRARVRRAAARVLGELNIEQALPALDRLRQFDPDTDVRAECTVSALLLGQKAVLSDAIALLSHSTVEEGLSLARRAALALAQQGELAAVPVLSSLAEDESADEVHRLHAVEALGQLRAQAAFEVLVRLLESVRFRVAVAGALGALGDARGVAVLAAQLRKEPYPPARAAEARALVQLKARAVVPIVRYLLGMETGVPLGVQVLVDMGALEVPSWRGARVSDARIRRGDWACKDRGCVPAAQASIALPASGFGRGAVRVTWLLAGHAGDAITIDGLRYVLKSDVDQMSFTRDSTARARSFLLAAEGEVHALAVAVTPVSAELPPPPPEPWQADEAEILAPE